MWYEREYFRFFVTLWPSFDRTEWWTNANALSLHNRSPLSILDCQHSFSLKGTCQENNIPLRQERPTFVQVRAHIPPFTRSNLFIPLSFLSCGSRSFPHHAPTHRDMRSLSSSRKSSVPCQSKWYRRSRGYKPTLIRLMTGADKMPDGLSGLKHRSLPVHLFFPLFICGMYVHVRGKRLPMRCLVIGYKSFWFTSFPVIRLHEHVPGHSLPYPAYQRRMPGQVCGLPP